MLKEYRVHKREGLPNEIIQSISSSDIVGFAGSRYLSLQSVYCKQVIDLFLQTGCKFAVGCANGVDRSFLKVLAQQGNKERAYFFRAFSSRNSLGLKIAHTSPSSVSHRRALGIRTAQFVKTCSLIVLYPENWGSGSLLCYRLAKEKGIPVVIISAGLKEQKNERINIRELKFQVDIINLIQSAGIKLKKRGNEYKGLCPFHDDTNPSLSVNAEKGLFYCFGCGVGGDVITFMQLYKKIDFKSALEYFARFHSVQTNFRHDLPEFRSIFIHYILAILLSTALTIASCSLVSDTVF
ncbi:MAG: hypothetical protein JRJ27_22000 [Deltaproteobacteria bacterium]|nr:hypothetical protein [Deltaproteobacteria bacterium]